jgi:four helix bundle protein
MQDFRKLKVWEKSHQLTLVIYKASMNFPKDEQYGLTSQLRRASSSVAANIAEGCGRRTDLDFARFLQNAMGSASELEYHLLLAHDLGYWASTDYQVCDAQVNEIKKMLVAFIGKLRAKN